MTRKCLSTWPPPGARRWFVLGLTGLFALLLFSGCSTSPMPKRSVFGDSLNLFGTDGEAAAGITGNKLTGSAMDGPTDSAVNPAAGPPPANFAVLPERAHLTHKILATAYTQYGLPYRYAGGSPQTGFDCSGFTSWAFAQHGFKLPRSASEYVKAGQPVSKNDLRPGDVLVFRRYRDSRGHHVGIYVGGGLFIHSPHTGERVKESPMEGAYNERLIGIRRFINDPAAGSLPNDLRDKIVAEALTRNNRSLPKSDVKLARADERRRTDRDKTRRTAADRAKPDLKTAKAALNAKAAQKPKTAQSDRASQKAKAAQSAKAGKKAPAPKTYQIKNGDTLWTVAKRFGVTHTELMAANRMKSNKTLRPGQTISIPD
jgi:LysM repeat protein